MIRSEEPCDNAKNQLSDFVQAQLSICAVNKLNETTYILHITLSLKCPIEPNNSPY